MKDFDLLAILLKPEFGAMLLHGLQGNVARGKRQQ